MAGAMGKGFHLGAHFVDHHVYTHVCGLPGGLGSGHATADDMQCLGHEGPHRADAALWEEGCAQVTGRHAGHVLAREKTMEEPYGDDDPVSGGDYFRVMTLFWQVSGAADRGEIGSAWKQYFSGDEWGARVPSSC